jgi:hypothetical protein
MDDIRNLLPLRPQIADNPEPGAVVPHVYSFSALYNSTQRLYSYRFDEALRNLPSTALAMRRDAFIEALHQERTYPTANRAWSVKVPDQRSAYQTYVSKCITQAIRAIPRFDRMRLCLQEAVWYGRYGVQVTWGKRKIDGKVLWTVTGYRPVNGDKIFFEYDGTPAVAINPTMASAYPYGLTKYSDRGMALLVLKRPEHRRQFIFHQHLVTDADYFEPEMAGGVHGTGLRNKVYWAWWLRDEMLGWCADFMQKVGTLGLLVFFYEDGNAAAKLAAEAAASKASTEVAITMPMPNGPSVKATNNVMHIPANTGGVEALQKMIADYFERHIERLYVGQPSSGGVEGNGFGGSAGAALHADTKYQLLKFDAKNLDESLTIDLIGQLIALNHPDVDFPVMFDSSVANPEDAAKLQGVQTAAGLGVTFKMDEVRALTGLSKPEEFDETIGGIQAGLDPAGAPGDPNGGGPAGGGDGETEPGQGVTSNDSVERENGSGTKWADLAAYADDGSYFESYVDDSGGGHWVTMGAERGDDGKAHGGVPVYIKGGRIVKGPKGMTGKRPSKINSGKEKGGGKVRWRHSANAQAAGDKLVELETSKMDNAWQKDSGFHVPPGGLDDKQKYKNAADFLASHKGEVDAPRATYQNGVLSFEDGRHRAAAARDAGHQTIHVTMDPGEADVAAKDLGPGARGYPAEWDEPLNEETASKKGPQFRVTSEMAKALPRGIHPTYIAELAADIRDNHNAMVEYQNDAINYARGRSVKGGLGSLSQLVRLAHKRGGDSESIRGLDLIAASTAAAYPGLIENDPTTNETDRLFDLVLGGVRPKMSDREAWELAVNYARENGLDRPDADPSRV